MKLNLKNFYNKYYPYIFTAIFLALSILLIINHEFWLDEVHHWNIARESSSISELFYHMRQSEGHPYLWNLILFFISHFISDNIESMKIIHLAFSTTSAFLILKFAPFNKLIKVLLIFSYFLFYEYSIISRNYALGVLLIIIFCILYKNKYKNILPISIVLALMGSVNLYSFLFSIFFVLLLLYDFIKDRNGPVKEINKIVLTISIIIIILGILFFYLQIGNQLINNTWSEGITSKTLFKNYFEKLKTVPDIIINAYFPIPEIKLNFWNTNILTSHFSNSSILFEIVFAIIFLLLSTLLLNKKFKIIFLSGSFLITNFMVLFYYGRLRHWGHIFILFLACLWLSKIEEENSKFYLIQSRTILFNKFLITILTFSLIATSIAFYYDFKYPFSQSKNVAEYIKNNFDTENLIIAGIPYAQTETISGYLNKPFYYPQEDKFGFNVFWADTNKNTTADAIIKNIFKVKSNNPEKDIITVKDKYSNSALSSLIHDDLLALGIFEFNKDFSGAIVQDEDYNLFILSKLVDVNLVKKIDIQNFKSYWKNIVNCRLININDNRILIKSETNDPNFESDFQIPKIDEKNKLLLKINIEVSEYSELAIYYKKHAKEYNENDKDTRNLHNGLNSVIFQIDNTNDIESIRIDPVNKKIDCIIESFEFYELSEK